MLRKYKYWILLILFLGGSNCCWSQSLLGPLSDTSIYYIPHVEPTLNYEGGEYQGTQVDSLISTLIKYPNTESDCCCRVVASLIIEKDGSVSNKRIERKLCDEFDREAMRIINSLDSWKPGTIYGQSVRIKKVYLFDFVLK